MSVAMNVNDPQRRTTCSDWGIETGVDTWRTLVTMEVRLFRRSERPLAGTSVSCAAAQPCRWTSAQLALQ